MNTPIPGKLRLAFSTAADRSAIKALFAPAVKNTIDPQGHVAGRDNVLFNQHIDNGRAALLQDEHGDVHTLTVAWHLSAENDHHPRPRHIEIGTAMTRLSGFHSASVIIAALALHEWWKPTVPRGLITAEISNDNKPSQKLFRDTLGWKAVTGRQTLANINELSYAGVVDYAHTDDRKTWYKSDRAARRHQAEILLDFLKRGSLTNKARHTITLDLSVLQKTGLTTARLEALANGVHTKKALRAIPF